MAFAFTSELFIVARPEAVWQTITDLPSWHKWMPNLVKVEQLTPGSFGAGTQWRETRKMFGKEASEVFEVVQAAPPHTIKLKVDGSKGTTGKGTYLFDYNIGQVPQGTLLRMSANIEMPGFFAKVMMKAFGGAMKKACEKDLQALKSHLEAEARAAAGAAPS